MVRRGVARLPATKVVATSGPVAATLLAGFPATVTGVPAGGPGEEPHARNQRLLGRIGIDALHQRDVELHERRLQLQDVAQARKPRARVIDRESWRRRPLGQRLLELVELTSFLWRNWL